MAGLKNIVSLGRAKRLFEHVTAVVFAVILLFITLTILIGTVRLFYRLAELLRAGGITGDYLYVFSDVLTLFILIELSRSIVEYFSIRRLRLTFIVDAAIVFVLRDVMIGLFQHKLEPAQIYALSVLLLVLGALRITSTLTHQRERQRHPMPEEKL